MPDSRPSYFGKLHANNSCRPHAAAVSVEVSPLVYFRDLLTVLGDIDDIEENDDECTDVLDGIEERMMNKHIRAGRLRKITVSTREEIDEEGLTVSTPRTRSVFSFLTPLR